MGRVFTTEQEKDIVDSYLSGVEQCDLGKKYAIDTVYIRNVLKKHSIKIRPKCRFNVIEAKRMYASGLSYERVASILGVTSESVRRVLLRRGGVSRNYTKKYQSDPGFFSCYTPESCYFAGLIAASGVIRKDKDVVAMWVTGGDSSIIHSFLKLTKSDNPINVKKTESNGCTKDSLIGFSISSVEWVRDLSNNFGITPCKSKTIKPPVKIPEPLIFNYIRGFFDGKGCVVSRDISISSLSEDIILWVSRITGAVTDYRGKMCIATVNSDKVKELLYRDSTPDTRLERNYISIVGDGNG